MPKQVQREQENEQQHAAEAGNAAEAPAYQSDELKISKKTYVVLITAALYFGAEIAIGASNPEYKPSVYLSLIARQSIDFFKYLGEKLAAFAAALYSVVNLKATAKIIFDTVNPFIVFVFSPFFFIAGLFENFTMLQMIANVMVLALIIVVLVALEHNVPESYKPLTMIPMLRKFVRAMYSAAATVFVEITQIIRVIGLETFAITSYRLMTEFFKLIVEPFKSFARVISRAGVSGAIGLLILAFAYSYNTGTSTSIHDFITNRPTETIAGFLILFGISVMLLTPGVKLVAQRVFEEMSQPSSHVFAGCVI